MEIKNILNEDFDYEIDSWSDNEVESGKSFFQDGYDWKWLKRVGDVVHLDFDNWAVWMAFRPEQELNPRGRNVVAFFLVDEDTGFIDWGPCETYEEAKEFLDSKVDDYNADEDDIEFVDNRKKSILSGDPLDDPGFDSYDVREAFNSGSKSVNEDINTNDLKSKLESTIRDEIRNLGYDDDFADDYIFIEIKDGKFSDGTPSVVCRIRTELSYDECMEIANALNPIIANEDKNAYFDMEDGHTLIAYLNPNPNEEKPIDTEVVNEWADIISQVTTMDELRKVYVSIRDIYEDKEYDSTFEAIHDVILEKADELNSMDEDLEGDLENIYKFENAHNHPSILDNIRELEQSELVDHITPVTMYDTEVFEMVATDGRLFYLVPSTLSQFDVYDENEELVTSGEFTRSIPNEVLMDKSNLEFLYELVGGEYAGTYTEEEVKALPCFTGKYTADQSDIRAKGGFTSRVELDNKPKLDGYLGPMMGGYRDGKMVLRYETQEVYDRLSEKLHTTKSPIREGLDDETFSQWFDKNCYHPDSNYYPFDNYVKTFESAEVLRDATAEDIRNNAHQFYDIYDVDSADREKAFNFASEKLGMDYDDFYYAWLKEKPISGVNESVLNERGLTRAERYNRNMEKIFAYKKQTDHKMMQFLRDNSDMTEEDIQKAYDDNKLSLVIKDLGLHDAFWDTEYKSKAIKEGIDEEQPYTKEEVERDLKSITHNFTDKEGELKCGFEEEKNFGVEILKKHYKVVEVSGDDRREGKWYHISYAEPNLGKILLPKNESLNEDLCDAYYKYPDDGTRVEVFIKEDDEGNFYWEDAEGRSDDTFNTREEALADCEEFIQSEIAGATFMRCNESKSSKEDSESETILTICPNCQGDRFNDNTGFCVDCGYDEKAWGELDEPKYNEDYEPERKERLSTSNIIKALKNHSVDYKEEDGKIIAINAYTKDGKTFEDEVDLTNCTYQKLRDFLGYDDVKESMNESFNDYIYLFPELTDEDIKMMAGYNIKYLGMNHGPDGSEDNWVVYGAKEDLEKYADKYLGYELHPDYLYEYDDFAGEIV